MNTTEQEYLKSSGLGGKTNYIDSYAPDVLFPIPRHFKRSVIGIAQGEKLPFFGFDIWNDYETSWLNSRGKPICGLTVIQVPCESPNIVESKSLKLYLNSFSSTQFSSKQAIEDTLRKDLSKTADADVNVQIFDLKQTQRFAITEPPGICLDQLDISIDKYTNAPEFLTSDTNNTVAETLHTNLLKSNCPATGQPDWGTLIIEYVGPQIDKTGLLKYVVSLRQQQEFHEQCIERIYMDIMQRCQLKRLTVSGRYTRRGGKDINPVRSSDPYVSASNLRLIRQ